MGTEAFWVPFAISAATAAAGAGATYINQRNTARKQDSELAAQLRGQASKQHEADAKTAALIAGEAKSSPVAQRQKIGADFARSLEAKAPQATAPLDVKGATSAAYEKSKADAQLGIAKYGAERGGNLADIDAPFAQRLDDSIKRGRFQTDINQIGRFNRGDTFLSNMRLANIKGDPKLALFSSLMNSVSSAAGGAAARGAGGSFPTGGAGEFGGGGAGFNEVSNMPFYFEKPMPSAWQYDPARMGTV